jgi:glutamate-1-semialdehyde aminotransferase
METGSWYATGGTLFGSALQMAACRATLEEVLVDGAYEESARLGGWLADGIDSAAGAVAVLRASATKAPTRKCARGLVGQSPPERPRD